MIVSAHNRAKVAFHCLSDCCELIKEEAPSTKPASKLDGAKLKSQPLPFDVPKDAFLGLAILAHLEAETQPESWEKLLARNAPSYPIN